MLRWPESICKPERFVGADSIINTMKTIFVLAVILISNLARGQNLVPNSSFEDINICTEYHQPCSPLAWFFVRSPSTQGYASIDRTPSATGNKHLTITVLEQNQNRQYWQCRLLCELQPGMTYSINIKIASPNTDPNLNDIGLYFTDSMIFSIADTILQPKNYISFLHASVKKLKNNWFELKTEFVSTAYQQFLMIGNFSGETDSIVLGKRKIADRSVSMLVDDVSVVAAGKNICADYLETLHSLYATHERHTFNKIVQHDTSKVVSSAYIRIDTFIVNDIQFGLDSYQFSNPNSLDYLKEHFGSSTLKEIKIYGYTDNSGTEVHNKVLSLKRANEIANIITSRFEVPASIIKTEGKGISSTYSKQEKNRRVEIYVYHY